MPSPRFVRALMAQETAEQPVILVTIMHAGLLAPLRWCTGGADLVSNGGAFQALAMSVALPGESADAGANRGRISVDNIDKAAIGALRQPAVNSRPNVQLDVVLAATPDVVELSWVGLSIVAGPRPGVDAIEMDIAPRDDGEETWPVQRITPARFPGLF